MEKKMQYLHDNLKMHIVYGGKLQYPHHDPNLVYVGALNVIPTWLFKDAHCILGKNAIPTLWP